MLINALSDSKITSGVIQGRVKEAEETDKPGGKKASAKAAILLRWMSDEVVKAFDETRENAFLLR